MWTCKIVFPWRRSARSEEDEEEEEKDEEEGFIQTRARANRDS